MSYTSLQQLTDRFGEQMLLGLTDRATPPAGVIDGGVVDRALVDTQAVIDGYLAGRYVLPLAEVPPLLADLALAIAIYKLHTYEPDKKIGDDYRDAVATLARISKGDVRLPLEGIEPASSGASGVETIDRERPLSPETMTGFI